MNIPPKIEDQIKARVASGHYDSEAAVMQRALDVLGEVERSEDEIRAKLETSREELDRGEGVDAKKVFAEMRREHHRRFGEED